MKDEIKITFPGQILDYVDTKEHLLELFNYITNLQEENERLLVDNKTLKRWYQLCKSRNEKAIEFVEENPWGIGYGEVSYLLDILQGDDKE